MRDEERVDKTTPAQSAGVVQPCGSLDLRLHPGRPCRAAAAGHRARTLADMVPVAVAPDHEAVTEFVLHPRLEDVRPRGTGASRP